MAEQLTGPSAALERHSSAYTVRDRKSSSKSNDTLLAKLPRWVKAAKNREPVLKCIEKLRALASDQGLEPRKSTKTGAG